MDCQETSSSLLCPVVLKENKSLLDQAKDLLSAVILDHLLVWLTSGLLVVIRNLIVHQAVQICLSKFE